MRSLAKVNRYQPVHWNNWVDDFFNTWPTTDYKSHVSVNVKESDTAFGLELAAPGLKREDITVDVKGNTLTISAKTEDKKEETAEKYTRKEFSFQSFKRTFTLPKTVNIEAINAVYADGILQVTLPKVEAAIPAERTIEIG